ncbi:hypothetical protein DPMN_106044 [Dreissena polymorpha]|uniref:Uncharacterized protein n=1 Tax=Dreissena polymorpha TaxID=45954 RepID=A0A9D4K4D4_DREPO|nr:hypothetical protein DPMN_106044 [Dreissena polymorpha]
MSTNAATVLKDVVMAVKIRLGPIDTLTNVRLTLVAVRKYAPTTVGHLRVLAILAINCRLINGRAQTSTNAKWEHRNALTFASIPLEATSAGAIKVMF